MLFIVAMLVMLAVRVMNVLQIKLIKIALDKSLPCHGRSQGPSSM